VTVNKERVQLLVDALRSGEFAQAQGALRRADIFQRESGFRYCCLGVATEIALRGGLEVHSDHYDAEYGLRPWDQDHQIMCRPVFEWYGFDDGSPALTSVSTGETHQAATWNDEYEASFDDIADMFESTYIRETTPA